MTAPLIVILMGSRADEAHARKVAEAAAALGIETVLRVGSAHKTPEHVLAILKEYEPSARPLVYITIAGRSNALSGFVDGCVTAPVIACPPPSEAFGGADVYSSLRMPSGIAPAVVLEPTNAALLAAKIFALSDPALRTRLVEFKGKQVEKILQDDGELHG
ncbi:MAG TPA: 5-(carboxyamino)imidazole ribonucleotide mutase [Anaerolineaceae bacterium]|nr:MAG: 5-(carboxyamino)imidazole ribonucleotide mutase [Chloroflexi bacterium GWB2_54_36]HAL16488.1 5-(carboxyamino)imidazole ribonucleotide mutase [Anaerolineaceae bacterium]